MMRTNNPYDINKTNTGATINMQIEYHLVTSKKNRIFRNLSKVLKLITLNDNFCTITRRKESFQ